MSSPQSASPQDPQIADAHSRALQQLDAAITFLRSREAPKLNPDQKKAWKQIGDQLVQLLNKLGGSK